jgi:hypothetical protein
MCRYNSTFYMLGSKAACAGVRSATGPILDASVVHTNASGGLGPGCSGLVTEKVRVARPASDQAVTAAAKKVLGAFPKPWSVEL